MQRPVSISLRATAFALLALGSLALKAAAGPPRDALVDASPDRFEHLVTTTLQAQHFAVTRRTYAYRGTLFFAARGDCRLAARDAKWGDGTVAIYQQDARSIGPISYLYRGHRYPAPPGLRVRLGRVEFEALSRLGMQPTLPVLVAFAESPGCDGRDFGLSDLRI